MGIAHVPAVGPANLRVGVQLVEAWASARPVRHVPGQLADLVLPVGLRLHPVGEPHLRVPLSSYLRCTSPLAVAEGSAAGLRPWGSLRGMRWLFLLHCCVGLDQGTKLETARSNMAAR